MKDGDFTNSMSMFDIMEAKAMMIEIYKFMNSTINIPYDRENPQKEMEKFPVGYDSYKVVSMINLAMKSKDNNLIAWLQSFDYSLPGKYYSEKSKYGDWSEILDGLAWKMRAFHEFVSEMTTQESRITDDMVSEFSKFLSDDVVKNFIAREILNHIDTLRGYNANSKISRYLCRQQKNGNISQSVVKKDLYKWLKTNGFDVASLSAFNQAWS